MNKIDDAFNKLKAENKRHGSKIDDALNKLKAENKRYIKELRRIEIESTIMNLFLIVLAICAFVFIDKLVYGIINADRFLSSRSFF